MSSSRMMMMMMMVIMMMPFGSPYLAQGDGPAGCLFSVASVFFLAVFLVGLLLWASVRSGGVPLGSSFSFSHICASFFYRTRYYSRCIYC